METKEIIINGKVQGVFFRASVKEVADELGISGTVNNLADGSVKITATADPAFLKQLVDWCHHGPARAIVDNVKITDLPFQEFEGFRIIRG